MSWSSIISSSREAMTSLTGSATLGATSSSSYNSSSCRTESFYLQSSHQILTLHCTNLVQLLRCNSIYTIMCYLYVFFAKHYLSHCMRVCPLLFLQMFLLELRLCTCISSEVENDCFILIVVAKVCEYILLFNMVGD